MTRLISFAVLIAIIIVIGLLFYKVLIGFFIPVFLAAVLVVVFRPLHRWVLEKTGHRERIAAALTTLLMMVTLLLPIGVVVSAAAVQGLRLLRDNDASTVKLRMERIRVSLGLQMPPFEDKLRKVGEQVDLIIEYTSGNREPALIATGKRTVQALEELKTSVQTLDGPKWDPELDEIIEMASSVGMPSEIEFGASKTAVELKSKYGLLRTAMLGGSIMALARETANPTTEDIDRLTKTVVEYARPRLLSITGATGSFIIRLIFGSVILVVATFFFFYDGPAMIKNVMNLSPLDDAYEQELLLEFDRISRAVVLATILSAIVQGLTAGLGYAVAGMEYLTLLIMLTTVFAMVPFVGPAVVWVPVCLYLGIYEERVTAAIILAVWGIFVVGTVDNLVKAFVLHGQSQLHPLLALLSVLGGVQTLGPIGIVVGPMVVAMLQTLLSILQRELLQFEGQELVLSTEGTSVPSRGKARRKAKLAKQAASTPETSPAPNKMDPPKDQKTPTDSAK